MYLLGPMQLSFAEIVTFSAATVIALIGVNFFFPQRMVAACRLTVLPLWIFGSYAAVRGGFVAGQSIEPRPSDAAQRPGDSFYISTACAQIDSKLNRDLTKS